MINLQKQILRYILLSGLVVLISFTLYIAWSMNVEGLGFPIDDAWIHQTYGRNFGKNLQWSFSLDTPSGGSTGPAWGILIGIMYLLGIPPILGTFFLGYLFLWGSAVAAILIFNKFGFTEKVSGLIAGSLIGLEWHIVWAALSGMETIVIMFLVLLLFYWFFTKKENWWFPGILIGLSVWIRPDGITLLGPALFILYFREYTNKIKIRKLLSILGSFILIFGLYILFNWMVAGDIWPNTFYAKQAEYAVLRENGFGYRYFNVSLQFFIGVGVLLFPGMILEALRIVQKKEWDKAAAIIWVLGYIGLYAWRLPVTYQHGRYIMPAMPLGFLIGLAGMMRWTGLKEKAYWQRVISRVWIGSAIIVATVFWIMGARTYARDVAVIETEMVQTSQWVMANTNKSDVLAAHDIGALGYFSNRKILDLAGLITPDVIPFIRNEDRLRKYLDQNNVDYLMTFPDWYPGLINGLELAYKSNGKYAPEFGSSNMTIYYWK